MRPDVPENAVWERELGMDVIYDQEGAWINEHRNSDDPIDRAILKSVEIAMETPPSAFSSISPYDYDGIVSVMGSLDFKLLPELWK